MKEKFVDASKTEIIIPTYNRSAKLERTLKCYHLFENGFIPRITVLDGSNEQHSVINKKNCERYPNVTYLARPGSALLPRIANYLSESDSDRPVCIATDEDVFLPDYISTATNFLNENKSYSMFLGRYITFARPLGPFRRLAQFRHVATSLDINQDDFSSRVSMVFYAVTVGCVPFYWGIRRANQRQLSSRQMMPLYYQTSQEVVDQILLAFQGKIKLVDMPMLLRDETKIDYVHDADREDVFNYFPPSEKEIVEKILLDAGGEKLVYAGGQVLDKYLLESVDPRSPCIALQRHQKVYSKFQPLEHGKSKFLARLIYIVLKGSTVLTEILIAPVEVRYLKKLYGSSVIKAFLKKIRVHTLAGS